MRRDRFQTPEFSLFRSFVCSFFRFVRKHARSDVRRPRTRGCLTLPLEFSWRNAMPVTDKREKAFRILSSDYIADRKRKVVGRRREVSFRNSKRKLAAFLFPSFNCVSVTLDFLPLAIRFVPKIFLIYFHGF